MGNLVVVFPEKNWGIVGCKRAACHVGGATSKANLYRSQACPQYGTIPSDPKVLLTTFKSKYFEILRISCVVSWNKNAFLKILRVQSSSKIMKSKHQEISVVSISCQRVFSWDVLEVSEIYSGDPLREESRPFKQPPSLLRWHAKGVYLKGELCIKAHSFAHFCTILRKFVLRGWPCWHENLHRNNKKTQNMQNWTNQRRTKSTRKRNTPENAGNRPLPESAFSGVLRFRVCFGALLEGSKTQAKKQHTRKRRFWERSVTCIFGCEAFSALFGACQTKIAPLWTHACNTPAYYTPVSLPPSLLLWESEMRPIRLNVVDTLWEHFGLSN